MAIYLERNNKLVIYKLFEYNTKQKLNFEEILYKLFELNIKQKLNIEEI